MLRSTLQGEDTTVVTGPLPEREGDETRILLLLIVFGLLPRPSEQRNEISLPLVGSHSGGSVSEADLPAFCFAAGFRDPASIMK